MNLTVRRLQPADATHFQALRLRGLIECPTAFASSHEEECTMPEEVIAQRLAHAPARAVFGAFDAVLAGIVGLQREAHLKLAHKGFIWGMYVAPEYRQRGVGRKLIDAALAHAYSLPGIVSVNLSVNAANPAAIALYEAAGFARYGVERDFMRVDGVPQDEIHMVHRRTTLAAARGGS